MTYTIGKYIFCFKDEYLFLKLLCIFQWFLFRFGILLLSANTCFSTKVFHHFDLYFHEIRKMNEITTES